MLTKWELTKWELTKWEVDEVGRFTILYTSNHCYRSVKFLVHHCQEMTKLYGAPGCDETAVNNYCLIHERRWTSGESGLEQPVTTFGNLEKFYEAETIYIDRAIPQLFYQLFRVHAGQPIRHTVNCIPTSSSHRQHHITFFDF